MVFGIALALRLRFGAVAHFAEYLVGWKTLSVVFLGFNADVEVVHCGIQSRLRR